MRALSRDTLPAINSMTKYPPIPTYHTMDLKTGMLTPEVVPFFGTVYATEKVDGTNGRIVVFPDGDWLIGSREEWFTARYDRVPNPQLRIVEALAPVAQRLAEQHGQQPTTAYYLEVYGHEIGQAAKQYAREPEQLDCRLFDVAIYTDADLVLSWPRERIASWRDHGGQPFVTEHQLREIATARGLEPVPRLFSMDADDLPTDVDGMHGFLAEWLPATRVALDGRAGLRPEGMVLRDHRRLHIAKARFQDYERTARRNSRGKTDREQHNREGASA